MLAFHSTRLRPGFALALTVVALLTLFALVASPALAQVTIGTPQSGNTIPFGVGPGAGPAIDYPTEYQQLYRPSDFLGPLTIRNIGFSSYNYLGNGLGPATFDVTVGFSTTVRPFDAPSTTFTDNEGPDFQIVFSGTVSTKLLENGTFDLVFPTAPYFYDPNNGTLLVDIVVNSTPSVTKAPVLFESDNSGSAFHRVFTLRANQTSPTGLVTQFNVPPTLILLTFPSSVPDGPVVMATVTLSGPAPFDILVGLSSSDSSVVRLHRAVVVPAGSSSVTFPITTYPSQTTKTVTLRAALGQVVLTKDLTITGG